MLYQHTGVRARDLVSSVKSGLLRHLLTVKRTLSRFGGVGVSLPIYLAKDLFLQHLSPSHF